MGVKEDVQQKVLTMLTEGIGLQVNLGKGGMLRIEFNDSSTAVFIEVDTWGKDDQLTAVSATSPLLRGVPGTPEVFTWIATEGAVQCSGQRSVVIILTKKSSKPWFLQRTLLRTNGTTSFRSSSVDSAGLILAST